MDLSALQIVPIKRDEQAQFKALMDRLHHPGALPKIGESAYCAAALDGQWVAH